MEMVKDNSVCSRVVRVLISKENIWSRVLYIL